MSTPSGLRALVGVACLLAALLGAAGCSDLSGTDGKGYISGEGSVTELAPSDRGEPVDVSGEDLEGAAIALDHSRGRPTVVNVWWSGCPPCRVEQPELNAAAEELGDEVEFVGLNIRDASADQALAYVRSFEVPYPSVYSPDGKALLPFSGTLTPRSIPSTVVLDDEGRIAATIMGRIPSEQTLVSVVEKVLDE